MPEDKNRLHYGDNLSVLRSKDSVGRPYIPDQSVDLIYRDPPFNSRQDYNVLFAEKDGSRSASQRRNTPQTSIDRWLEGYEHAQRLRERRQRITLKLHLQPAD